METLIAISQNLTPDQQQMLDKMSPQQKRALFALVDERLNGDAGRRWLAENFYWVRLLLTRFIQ
jgi:hypothetical protein